MKISNEIQQRLICPATKTKLNACDGYLQAEADPQIRYPIVNGIPVLVNSQNSIFSIEDFTNQVNTTFELD